MLRAVLQGVYTLIIVTIVIILPHMSCSERTNKSKVIIYGT
jgi:hypothetical protein